MATERLIKLGSPPPPGERSTGGIVRVVLALVALLIAFGVGVALGDAIGDRPGAAHDVTIDERAKFVTVTERVARVTETVVVRTDAP